MIVLSDASGLSLVRETTALKTTILATVVTNGQCTLGGAAALSPVCKDRISTKLQIGNEINKHV